MSFINASYVPASAPEDASLNFLILSEFGTLVQLLDGAVPAEVLEGHSCQYEFLYVPSPSSKSIVMEEAVALHISQYGYPLLPMLTGELPLGVGSGLSGCGIVPSSQ